MWSITVNDACIGSGSCTALAPANFRLGDDHKTYPLTPEAEAGEALLDAAFSCPVEAITVVDAETGDVLAP